MESMIKVLLVDDELFVREQVSRSIQWEVMGLELIGCCSNAIEALEQIVDEMPDILITDIKMPVMDGLELIGRVKQMNPDIRCVVLSGYAEFSLAKTALEQGVLSYLLKPFSKVEFENVLQKCREHILQERSNQVLNLKQRTELVAQLTKELQKLRENADQVDGRMLQTIMKKYPDKSLLKEAGMLLVLQHSEPGKDKQAYVAEILNAGENLFDIVAKLLKEPLPEEMNESLLIRKVKDYTNAHYDDERLNLQLIADSVVHLGVKYVGRSFLKETGYKYSEYLLEIRMERAKHMLRAEEEYRIEDIAEQVGLGHDIPYFYQLFKKYTGMTPKEYKNS